MDKYFGLTTRTLNEMFVDFTRQFSETCMERLKFPNDPWLLERLKYIHGQINELSQELLDRMDEPRER